MLASNNLALNDEADRELQQKAPANMNHNNNEHKLGRRFSTPARLKTQVDDILIKNRVLNGSSQNLRHQLQHKVSHKMRTTTASSKLSRHFSLMKVNSLRYHRHSPATRSFNHHLSHQVEQTGDKSASPASSSSASDSAFSQSQTTLESEISDQQTNCFRRSLKVKETPGLFALHDDKEVVSRYVDTNNNRAKTNLSDSNNNNIAHLCDCPSIGSDPANLSINEEDDINQFKMIWRNLSYRVPEKRFARSIAWLKSKREAWWPTECLASDDPLPASDGHVVIDTVKGRLEVIADDAPKAPTIGKPRKVIFSQLNGCVRSGQLTAILGPSGAGKTTFLKCLTSSITKGVSGRIDITGGQASSHHLKLCIIPQKDYLFDNLTVTENLIFASRIKNTRANFNHLENVERVASLLGLQGCLKVKTSRLSGGQYKRVSIAQELLSKPDILILDEPTSGLDSLTCFRTVSVLRDLVNKSREGLIPPLAIVMTIHQPQIKIFNLFHHVYILSSMGQCVYEGSPEFLTETVADCCKLLPPPDDLNPASFIIDLASEVYGKKPIEQLNKLQNENFASVHSTMLQSASGANSNILGQMDLSVKSDPLKQPEHLIFYAENNKQQLSKELKISHRLVRRNNHDHSFWLHTWLLVKRLWISMYRDPLLTTTRVAFHLIIPFVFYFIYSQKSGAANACPYVEREFDFQSMASEATIQRLAVQHNELILSFENVSLFFLLLYSFSMCVLAVTALSFPLNMQILLKETSNGWYSMPRFVMAKTLADLPIELTMPTISVAIAYVMTGQPSSYLCWRMLTVTTVMTLCSLISQTQGLLFGAYFMNNVQAAVFISQASSLPWILLSGFTTRVSELPTVLQWLSFGSIYRLGIESIVAVRYGFGMCPCDHELVNGTPAKIVGVPDQIKSVMRYYLDMYTESPSPATASNSSNPTTDDIFDKIASTLSRANTYGVDVVSCQDVKPFILSAREVDENTLPTFILILVLIFVGLKISLFCVVRLRAG